MKAKSKYRYIYTFYLLLFSALIVFRMLFEGGIGGSGGVWNIFQVVFVMTGIYILLKTGFSIINHISSIKALTLFSLYIWVLSYPYLGDFTYDTIYYFLVVPFAVMVILTFYYFGLKNNINNSSWILLILFYAIALLFFSKRQNYLLGYNEEGTLVANAYYSLCLLPLILIYHKKKLSAIPFIITIAVILFSGKRAGILAVGIMLPMYYLTFSKKVVRNVSNVLILILIVITLNYIYNFFEKTYNLDMLSRLANIVEDGGSNRDIIWTGIFDRIINSNSVNFLFGHGYKRVFRDFGGEAHNDFLQVFYEYGLFALVMYISFYISLFKLWLKMQNKKYPYAKNFLMSIVAALFMAMFSFFIVEPRIIICSSLCWGLFLADWRKFQINGYVVNTIML